MKIIKVSQENDREAFLQLRLGKIGGSKVKSIKPLTRGLNKTPMGFWQLLAEKVAVAPDGEKPEDRGQRLENDALARTALQFHLDLDLDPGMWISDYNEDIAVSPDGAENSEKPIFAAEAKCLSSALHLKYVITDMRDRLNADYSAIDHVPNDSHNSYKEQVIQYFVVNEDLRKLYFTLYDDRIAIEKYVHHVIVIEREDIEEEIEAQRIMQIDVLEEVNALVAEMAA